MMEFKPNDLFSLQMVDDRVLYYMCVDSLKPTDILVSFSALVHWGDTGGKINTKHKSKINIVLLDFFLRDIEK